MRRHVARRHVDRSTAWRDGAVMDLLSLRPPWRVDDKNFNQGFGSGMPSDTGVSLVLSTKKRDWNAHAFKLLFCGTMMHYVPRFPTTSRQQWHPDDR